MGMRAALLVLVAAGCYAPRVAPGVACDPAADNCPSGQTCAASAAGFVCVTPGERAVDAAADGMTDAAADARPDAPPDAAGHVEYTASVSDCVNRVTPDPDSCASLSGLAGMLVDMSEATTMQPTDGFVRFDLDGALAGKTIVSATLRLTATNDARAAGPASGVLYRVQPFTRATLAMTEPAKIGSQPVSPGQGAVAKLQPVNWPLPTSLVSANGSVFLEIVNTNTDGVIYGTKAAAAPPLLLIDYF